jgi:hypothetical protein
MAFSVKVFCAEVVLALKRAFLRKDFTALVLENVRTRCDVLVHIGSVTHERTLLGEGVLTQGRKPRLTTLWLKETRCKSLQLSDVRVDLKALSSFSVHEPLFTVARHWSVGVATCFWAIHDVGFDHREVDMHLIMIVVFLELVLLFFFLVRQLISERI